MSHSRKIAVIGLGYVGLPVAVAFARTGASVVGFDIDHNRVDELRSGRDRTLEVTPDDLEQKTLRFEHEPSRLADADFYIVTVPTPIDGAHRPDLGAISHRRCHARSPAGRRGRSRFAGRHDTLPHRQHRLTPGAVA